MCVPDRTLLKHKFFELLSIASKIWSCGKFSWENRFRTGILNSQRYYIYRFPILLKMRFWSSERHRCVTRLYYVMLLCVTITIKLGQSVKSRIIIRKTSVSIIQRYTVTLMWCLVNFIEMTKKMQPCRTIYYSIVSWLLNMFREVLSLIIRSF
jgi:hypothetical protein